MKIALIILTVLVWLNLLSMGCVNQHDPPHRFTVVHYADDTFYSRGYLMTFDTINLVYKVIGTVDFHPIKK